MASRSIIANSDFNPTFPGSSFDAAKQKSRPSHSSRKTQHREGHSLSLPQFKRMLPRDIRLVAHDKTTTSERRTRNAIVAHPHGSSPESDRFKRNDVYFGAKLFLHHVSQTQAQVPYIDATTSQFPSRNGESLLAQE